MAYQNIINLFDSTTNQPSKFRPNWVEISNEERRQIIFNTKMLKSSLFYYSDENIFIKRTITVTNTATGLEPTTT